MKEGTRIRVTYEDGTISRFKIGYGRYMSEPKTNPQKLGITLLGGDTLYIPSTDKQGIRKFFSDKNETPFGKIKSIDVELPLTKAQQKARRKAEQQTREEQMREMWKRVAERMNKT